MSRVDAEVPAPWSDPIRHVRPTRILLDAAGGVSGITIRQAARDGLESMKSRVGGHGGIIAALPDGSWAIEFSTERMAWGLATADEGGVHATKGSEREALEGGGVMQVGIDAPPPRAL